MEFKFVLLASVFTLYVYPVEGFSHFRDRLPNGHRVPHPCKANYMWYGVGHENTQGGGSRNPFGRDFEKYGFTWNECLCRADSDGDGRTNGEELGDPDCMWSPGKHLPEGLHITHPGVCEPYNSAVCKDVNSFLDCEVDVEFNCDAIKAPDVQNITLRISETAVPSDDTTYMCQAFNLPNDTDYHVIATTPYLDNRNVMHHIVVYGCSTEQESTAWDGYTQPNVCGMVPCSTVLGIWSLGSNGLCLDDNMGFNIGSQGFKTVLLELHWNNPEMKSHYKDSSGMTLYYTHHKRPNDAGVIMAAPGMVQIPPGYLSYDNYGGCSGECMTQMIGNNPINLTYLLPHMHYLGSSLHVEHIRNGKVLKTISVPQYFYDSPEVMYFKNHIEVYGGDELRVNCTFDSKSKKDFTYFGLATSDEMCIAIFMYYPYQPNVGMCMMTDGYGICHDRYVGDVSQYCNKTDFHTTLGKHMDTLTNMCDDTGIVCKPGCEEALQPIKQHHCLQSQVALAVKADLQWTKDTQKVLNILASCDPKPVHDIGDDVIPIGSCDITASAAMTDVTIMLIGLMVITVKTII